MPEVDFLADRRRLARNRWLMRRLADVLFIKTTMKVTVSGLENIPHSSPTLLLLNHVSNLDPIPVAMPIRFRDVTPIGKVELYESIWTRWLVVGWGAIPIRRFEFDRAALRQALAVLQLPDMLMIAPEGHRNKALTAPKEGFVYLAHKSQAVMVPAGVSGTLSFGAHLRRLQRTPITVKYGRPLRLRPDLKREEYALAAQEIMYQIAALVSPELRGDYADLSRATMETLEYFSLTTG